MSTQENKNTYTTIEQEFKAKLTGDNLKHALDFASHWGTDDITAESGDFCGVVKYKGEDVCYIKVGGFDDPNLDHWVIWSIHDADIAETPNFAVDERIKEGFWANVNLCGHFLSGGEHCGCGQQPGRRKVIFGKAFDNVCNSDMVFTNPDSDALECAKMMVDLRKRNIEAHPCL
ncbi:MAG: hypothetical protein FWC71_05815 [Defluviitaleaceae bacterium]|nr:hypothetical protein [Defluviitaleaceae bacterium]